MFPAASVTGFVVAGGRSQRMGRDKALLPWGDATLLDHALDRLRAVTDDVRILCGAEPRYRDRGVPVVADAFAESGPLVGVASGLGAMERSVGLFLAVDLPNVPVALLRSLVSLAADADAVVPLSPGGIEPLCAVYARTCLASIERAIASGNLKMTGFWPELRVRRLAPAELLPFGDPAFLFANVNAPADFERAKETRNR